MNYRDDPRLNDTHVLKPEWVTDGIYKLLNARELEKQSGFLTLKQAITLLPSDRYPQDRVRFLIDLMEKFELSFPMKNGYLIPELLTKQQPAEAAEFDPAKCLHFEYHYRITPEGLLPRFIVRTHEMSAEPLRWRTGVILDYDDMQALVVREIKDQKIRIAIRGKGNARAFLNLIRHHFDVMHRDLRGFSVKKWVPVPQAPGEGFDYDKLLQFERDRVREQHVIVDGRTRPVTVSSLLDGVGRDTEAARVFYSYSHKDGRQHDRMKVALAKLKRIGLVDSWSDVQIKAGSEWRTEIGSNLEQADVILLLISPDFIASDFCYEIELKRAIERHDAGAALVIPIVIRPTDWDGLPFAKLQMPLGGKPVGDGDKNWAAVSTAIEKAIREFQNRQSPKHRRHHACL